MHFKAKTIYNEASLSHNCNAIETLLNLAYRTSHANCRPDNIFWRFYKCRSGTLEPSRNAKYVLEIADLGLQLWFYAFSSKSYGKMCKWPKKKGSQNQTSILFYDILCYKLRPQVNTTFLLEGCTVFNKPWNKFYQKKHPFYNCQRFK